MQGKEKESRSRSDDLDLDCCHPFLLALALGSGLRHRIYRYRYRQGQSKCMFSANTGNELRVQTLVVDLCVRCELRSKQLETVLLNDIPVIFDIIFISM